MAIIGLAHTLYVKDGVPLEEAKRLRMIGESGRRVANVKMSLTACYCASGCPMAHASPWRRLLLRVVHALS